MIKSTLALRRVVVAIPTLAEVRAEMVAALKAVTEPAVALATVVSSVGGYSSGWGYNGLGYIVDGALILVIINGMDLSITSDTKKGNERSMPTVDIHSYGGHNQQWWWWSLWKTESA